MSKSTSIAIIAAASFTAFAAVTFFVKRRKANTDAEIVGADALETPAETKDALNPLQSA